MISKKGINFLVATLYFVFFSIASFSQSSKNTEHKVVAGETITQIATKYKVAVADIYSLNPSSKNGIKLDMILRIPKVNPKPIAPKLTVSENPKTHKVITGETLYSLTQMFSVSLLELEGANPGLVANGLKIGQIITIPSSKITKTPTLNIKKTDADIEKAVIKKTKTTYHIVETKETKYSIAKKYGITVADLNASNPEIKEELPLGYKLKIVAVTNNVVETKKAIEIPIKGVTKPVIIAASKTEAKKIALKNYTVKSKETLFGLAQMTYLTEEELMKINPELKSGVNEGMIIQIPAVTKIDEVEGFKKVDFADLSKQIKNQNKKKLVLLLPFNLAKMETDTTSSTAAIIKKDKFLTMTLDFYSGAMMAIDSAKTLGLNIDVKILDSQETKNSSNVANLISNNNLETANAVIGPFYQVNAEKTAEILNKSNVPVISPLSKETNRMFDNLLQSMPSSEILKNAIFDYIHAKNGNIVGIVDPKRMATKQYLTDSHKDVKLVELDDKGSFTLESITAQLVKNTINYVILDSEKTGTILKATNMLIGLLPNYPIQLVILEKNPTLDFEEIPLSKLTKLKMLFPSLNKDNNTPEGTIFEKEYKLKNKIAPNQYATRGFDITFDTMLRLSQEKSFIETIENTVTQQVENKFQYIKSPDGGYFNKGVYILYYDTDLSVKEAN